MVALGVGLGIPYVRQGNGTPAPPATGNNLVWDVGNNITWGADALIWGTA